MESPQSHSGSGDSINIQALGGGDAFGGDKVMGDKHEHHYPLEVKKEPPGKEYRLPSRNIAFTGREDALTAIAEGFEAQAATGVIRQAGSGMGGVGKTTLAVEYAYRYAERYDLLAFLDAGSPDVLDNSLLGLAEHLHLSGENAEEKRNELRHWLFGHSRWLLIMDNADDAKAMQAVQAFVPNLASGHVLITTRMENPPGIPKTSIQSVGEFTREEAIAFLQKKTGADGADAIWRQGAAELAEELGDLPLALEQAAALIIRSGLSLAEYLDAYRQEKLDLLKEGAEYVLLEKPELKQVAVTWNMNLKAVAEQKPILKELLNLSAMMAPETIPFEWIKQGLAETEPEAFGAYATSGNVKRMLTPLHDYSLVQRDGEKGFQLHRLVQAVIRYPLSEEEKAACHLRCMRAVIRMTPERDQFHTWDKQLYAQGLFLAQCVWNQDSETMALLCNETGYYTEVVLGDLKTAEPLYIKALKINESVFGACHSATALSCNNLGYLYKAQRDYGRAEPLYVKALEIYEGLFGERHSDTARSYNNLGALYKAQEDYGRAEPLYVKALEIRKGLFGERHSDTASSYNNLGYLYKAQGDYGRAESLYVKALEIYEALFGERHPDTATCYNNLGGLYQAQGDYARAEPLLEKALVGCLQTLGPEHPNAMTFWSNVATLYQAMGLNDVAIQERLQALFEKAASDDSEER